MNFCDICAFYVRKIIPYNQYNRVDNPIVVKR